MSDLSERFKLPFEHGFTRELVCSFQQKLKFRIVVYYRTPGKSGKRLRSRPEIEAYLKEKKITVMTPDDFCFNQHPIHEPPQEIKIFTDAGKGGRKARPKGSTSPKSEDTETPEKSPERKEITKKEKKAVGSAPQKTQPKTTEAANTQEEDDSATNHVPSVDDGENVPSLTDSGNLPSLTDGENVPSLTNGGSSGVSSENESVPPPASFVFVKKESMAVIEEDVASDEELDDALAFRQAYGQSQVKVKTEVKDEESVDDKATVKQEKVSEETTPPDSKSEPSGENNDNDNDDNETQDDEDIEDDEQDCECHCCSDLFRGLAKLKEHHMKEHSLYMCFCGNTYKMAAKLTLHEKSCEKAKQETSRQKKVITVSVKFDKHGKLIRNTENHKDKIVAKCKLKCGTCSEEKKTESELQEHEKTCGQDTESVASTGQATREKRKRVSMDSSDSQVESKKTRTAAVVAEFKCEKCAKTFKTEDILSGHMRVSHKTDAFECKDCKREFRSKTWLQRHACAARQSQKTLKCGKCSAEVKTESELKEHEKTCTKNTEAASTREKRTRVSAGKTVQERKLENLLTEAKRVSAVANTSRRSNAKANVSYKETGSDDDAENDDGGGGGCDEQIDDSDCDEDYVPEDAPIEENKKPEKRRPIEMMKRSTIINNNKAAQSLKTVKSCSTVSKPKVVVNNKRPISAETTKSPPSAAAGSPPKVAKVNDPVNKKEVVCVNNKQVTFQLPVKIADSVNKSSSPEVRMMHGPTTEGKTEWIKVIGKRIEESENQCFYCDESNVMAKLIVAHQVDQHSDLKKSIGDIGDPLKNKGKEGYVYFFCRHCNFIGVQRSVVWHHMKSAHSIKNILLPFTFKIDQKALNNFDQKVKYYCMEEHCDYSVHQPQNIIEHLLIRHKTSDRVEPGYICVDKVRSSNTGEQLQRIEVFMCQMCQFVAFRRSLIENHCIEVHAQKFLLYQCTECDEQFLSNSQMSLSDHFKKHAEVSKPQVSVTVIDMDGVEDRAFTSEKDDSSSSSESSETLTQTKDKAPAEETKETQSKVKSSEKGPRTSAKKKAKSEQQVKVDKYVASCKAELAQLAAKKAKKQ